MSRKRSREERDDDGHPTSILTQQELDYYYYYQFVRRDSSDEFGTVRTRATNGWQVEAGLEPADKECNLVFQGRLPINSELELDKMKCPRHNAFLLTECPYAVFYPIDDKAPHLSVFYFYTFKAKESPYPGPRGKKIFFVDTTTVKWTPLPMSTYLVMEVVRRSMPGKRHDMLRHMLLEQLKTEPPSKKFSLKNLEDLLGENVLEKRKLHRVGIIKRLFFHEVLVHLYKYYDADDLEHVANSRLAYMASIITRSEAVVNPCTLCYQSMCSEDRIICRDLTRVWYLPELTRAQYLTICEAKGYKYSPEDDAALRIYGALKNYIDKYKHTFIDYDTLMELAAITDAHLGKRAMYLLTEQYRVVVTQVRKPGFFDIRSPEVTFVYRKEDAVNEDMIAYCIDKTIRNFLASPPTFATPEEVEAYPMTPANQPCSEQLIALERAKMPFLALTGPGGSGKSEVLSRVMGMYNAIELMSETKFLTYQTNNAAEAARRNTPYATTCHRLMSKHFNKCKRSPLNRKKHAAALSASREAARTGQTPVRAEQEEGGQDEDYGQEGERNVERLLTVIHIPTVEAMTRYGDDNSNSFLDADEMREYIEQEEAEEAAEGEASEKVTKKKNKAEDSEFGEFSMCPLEHVIRVVVDEMGLLCELIFGPLLGVLTSCGNLKQIIVCGDYRQQKQMQPGDLQRDLLEGLTNWCLEFKHSHRFKGGAAAIHAHNAQAIHEMKPERLIIEPGVWEFIELEQSRYNVKTQAGRDILRNELITQLKSIGFDDGENCVMVTRTHVLRELASVALEEIQYGNVIPYALRVGQKIMCKDTIREIGVVSRQIFILLGIEDCVVPKGKTLAGLEAKDYVGMDVKFAAKTDTVTFRKRRGFARRLRVRRAGEQPDEDGKYRELLIPYDQRFRPKVVRASVLTERACQGSQGMFVVCLKPAFWDAADFKETFYVVATRQIERFVILSKQSYIKKWATNPTPERDTRLAEKLKKVYNTHAAAVTMPVNTPAIEEAIASEKATGIYELEEF